MDTVLLLKDQRLRGSSVGHTVGAPASWLLLERQTDSDVQMMKKNHITWAQLTLEFFQAEVIDDNRVKYFF